jgi:hypothetical protein
MGAWPRRPGVLPFCLVHGGRRKSFSLLFFKKEDLTFSCMKKGPGVFRQALFLFLDDVEQIKQNYYGNRHPQKPQ